MDRHTGGGPAAAMAGSVQRYPFVPGSLVDAERAGELFERYPMYRPALEWLREFVAAPHPWLGRSGDVCPRLRPALRRNLIWLVAVRTYRSTASEAYEKGLHLAGLFADLFPGEQARAGSLLALFPDLDADGAAEFIDGGHRLLRMQFVRRALMLGEFHPASEVAGVHGPRLMVMRAPVPMFAVRSLTPHDLMFLDRPQTPRTERLAYLRLYLHHLDGQLTPQARADAQARIAEAETATR